MPSRANGGRSKTRKPHTRRRDPGSSSTRGVDPSRAAKSSLELIPGYDGSSQAGMVNALRQKPDRKPCAPRSSTTRPLPFPHEDTCRMSFVAVSHRPTRCPSVYPRQSNGGLGRGWKTAGWEEERLGDRHKSHIGVVANKLTVYCFKQCCCLKKGTSWLGAHKLST